MIFTQLSLKGAFIIEPEIRKDNRGGFARVFCSKEFENAGLKNDFVQFNHSWNINKGTIRGMHFQKPPFRENKFIRCVHGAVLDVIVDLRMDSPTFLKYEAVELSDKNNVAIYVPEGFAHGFQTLTDNAQLIYHHTQYYVPEAEDGLRFDDPLVRINWPLPANSISERDANFALLTNTFKGI